MAVSIDQATVDGFRDNLRHLAQQKTSKARGWCDEFSPEAETGNWDRLASAEAAAKAKSESAKPEDKPGDGPLPKKAKATPKAKKT